MAHFAELDENDIILNVLVVTNGDMLDAAGEESEEVGRTFLQNWLGEDKIYVQTSYNNNFRGKIAVPGGKYDRIKDIFIGPAPFPSWTTLDENLNWQAPLPIPPEIAVIEGSTEYTRYWWDEENQSWIPPNEPEE